MMSLARAAAGGNVPPWHIPGQDEGFVSECWSFIHHPPERRYLRAEQGFGIPRGLESHLDLSSQRALGLKLYVFACFIALL